MVAQRKRGQPQRARPALGVLPQALHVHLAHRHAGGRQHLRRLVERHRQVRLAQLGELVLHAQAAEPQRRIRARRDHQPERGRRTVQQVVDVGVHRVGDLVEVVEHQHDRLLALRQRGGQRRDQRVGPRARVRRELGDRLARAGARERLEHGAPEPPPVAVGGIQREPGHRPGSPAGADPASEQRGLAGAGRPGDQRQGPPDALVEGVHQPAAIDDRRLLGWVRELRGRQAAGRLAGGRGRHSSLAGERTSSPTTSPAGSEGNSPVRWRGSGLQTTRRTCYERPRSDRLPRPCHRPAGHRRCCRGAEVSRDRARRHGDHRAPRGREGQAPPAVAGRRGRRVGRAVGRPDRPDLLHAAVRHGDRRGSGRRRPEP